MPATLTDFFAALGISELAGLPEEYLDLSPVLAAMNMLDSRFLGYVSEGEKASNFETEWIQEDLTPLDFVPASPVTAIATTITVASAVYPKLKVGMLLKALAKGTDEVMQITGIDTVTLTVTRTYGSVGTASAYEVTDVLSVISAPVGMNAAQGNWQLNPRYPMQNTCQFFHRIIEIPQVLKYIKAKTVPDEWQKQIKDKMNEMRSEMARAFINGVRGSANLTHVSTEGAQTTYTMDGLLRLALRGVDAAGAALGTLPITDDTAEALDLEVVNNLNHSVCLRVSQDFAPDSLFAHPTYIEALAITYADKLSLSNPKPEVVGFQARKLLTRNGNTLDLISDSNFPAKTIMISKRSIIKKRTLVPMLMAPVNVETWSNRARMIHVCTLEGRNLNSTTGIHTNLTV